MAKIIENNGKDLLLCFLCTLIALCFLFGHLVSNRPLVYLGAFILLLVFAAFPERMLFIELFLLPFANIIKLSSGQACLLSYFVIFGTAVLILKNRAKIVLDSSLIFTVGLVLILLLKAAVQPFGLSANYFRMIIMMAVISLLFVRIVKNGVKEENLAFKATLFLTVGVLLASLSGYIFFNDSNLSSFFSNTDRYYMGKVLYNRFCGLSSDPNYYSSFALMGVAANFFSFLNNRKMYHIVLAIFLAVFGILSLSKMFLILLGLCIIFFFISMAREQILKQNTATATIIVMTVIVAAAYYFLNNSDFVKVILYRINGSDNVESLTTGRSEAWISYTKAIFSSISRIVIGVNYDDLIIGVNHTHNTLLQIIWKFGLIGLSMFVGWFGTLKSTVRSKSVSGSVMLLIAVFGPAMALDMMVFDAFYWFYFFYLCARLEKISKLEASRS